MYSLLYIDTHKRYENHNTVCYVDASINAHDDETDECCKDLIIECKQNYTSMYVCSPQVCPQLML